MSTDPNFANFPPAPAKSKSKIWVWLGLGCGAMLLLCCGVGGGGSYYLFKKAVEISDDPAVVAGAKAEITDVELPPEFAPTVTLKITNPFSKGQGMEVVVYAPQDKMGMFMLMDLSGMGGQNPEQMRQQMEQSLAQQGHGARQLVAGDSRNVDLEIRGQPAKFVIQKGKDPQTNREFVQANGTFQGKKGIAVLVLQFPADKFDEKQVEDFLRTIK